LSGHHVCTIDDTSRDRSTRSATGSGKGIDNALRIRGTLESIDSSNNGGLVVTVFQLNRSIPSVGVEVSNTEIDLGRTVGETVGQLLGKLFLKNELRGGNGRRSI